MSEYKPQTNILHVAETLKEVFDRVETRKPVGELEIAQTMLDMIASKGGVRWRQIGRGSFAGLEGLRFDLVHNPAQPNAKDSFSSVSLEIPEDSQAIAERTQMTQFDGVDFRLDMEAVEHRVTKADEHSKKMEPFPMNPDRKTILLGQLNYGFTNSVFPQEE